MSRKIALLVSLLAAGCAPSKRTLPYYRTADLTPEWLDARVAASPATHRVGDFHFIDQRGEIVTGATLRGHVTLVSFFFTQCASVCPLTRANLSAVLARFPNESRLQVLLHSVTPAADSEAALAAYAAANQLTDPRWHLITGKPTDIEAVARTGYFVNIHDGGDYATNNLAHTESILIIDSAGRIRGVYSGSLRLEVDRIAADLAELFRES